MKIKLSRPHLQYLVLAAILMALTIIGLAAAQPSLVEQAYQAAEAGEWQQAVELFEQAALQDNSHPELWEQAGLAAWQNGEQERAAGYFEKVYQLNALSESSLQLWGEYLAETGRVDFAIAVAEEYLVQNPGAIQAQQHLAHLYQTGQQYQLALETWQSYLIAAGNDAEAQLNIGLLSLPSDLEDGKLYLRLAASSENAYQQTALDLLEIIEAAELNGSLAYTYTVAGQSLGSMGEWGLAALAFEHAVELEQEYAEAWAYYGQSLIHLGEDGSQALQQALALDPYSFSANLFMGSYLRSAGSLEKALEFFLFAAELDPINPRVQVEIGLTWTMLADLDMAVEAFQQAISLSPYNVEYHLILAAFCLDYDYFLDSIGLEAAREALRLQPESGETNLMIGRVYYEQGEIAQAQDFFQRALLVEPEDARIYYYLGVFYFDTGDLQSAETAFRTVLELDPESNIAAQAAEILGKYFP